MSTPVLLSVALLAISVFVTALLPFTGGTRLARAYLAVLILINAVVYLFRLLLLWESAAAVWMEYFVRLFAFFVGPVVFLYTREVLFHPGRDVGKVLLWGALPAVLGLTPQFLLRHSFEAVHASTEILAGRMPSEWYESASALFFALIQTVFVVKSWESLREYRRGFESIFSSDVGLQLRWIRIFLIVVALWVVALPAGHTLARQLFSTVPSKWTMPVSLVPVLLLFFFAFQHALRHPRPIVPEALPESGGPAQLPRSAVIAPNDLGEAARRRTADRLRRILEEDHFYLDPEASLPGLARQLEVTTHHLSLVIGAEFSTNFYGLINSHRAKEAAKMLRDPDFAEATILEVALRSGFNSKAAFNRVFKQAFLLTPREYRKGRD